MSSGGYLVWKSEAFWQETLEGWSLLVPGPEWVEEQEKQRARHHLAWPLEAWLSASLWAPGETGAAVTKRSRAGAGAAGSWPIPGG